METGNQRDFHGKSSGISKNRPESMSPSEDDGGGDFWSTFSLKWACYILSNFQVLPCSCPGRTRPNDFVDKTSPKGWTIFTLAKLQPTTPLPSLLGDPSIQLPCLLDCQDSLPSALGGFQLSDAFSCSSSSKGHCLVSPWSSQRQVPQPLSLCSLKPGNPPCKHKGFGLENGSVLCLP